MMNDMKRILWIEKLWLRSFPNIFLQLLPLMIWHFLPLRQKELWIQSYRRSLVHFKVKNSKSAPAKLIVWGIYLKHFASRVKSRRRRRRRRKRRKRRRKRRKRGKRGRRRRRKRRKRRRRRRRKGEKKRKISCLTRPIGRPLWVQEPSKDAVVDWVDLELNI